MVFPPVEVVSDTISNDFPVCSKCFIARTAFFDLVPEYIAARKRLTPFLKGITFFYCGL